MTDAEKIQLLRAKLEETLSENDRLRAENESMKAGLGAHEYLQSVWRNQTSPEANKIKAAQAALPVEKGKMPTAYSSLDVDRKQRWLAYERFLVTKRSLEETRQLPPKGWDAKLVEGVYEAPAGDGEPPMDLYGQDAIPAHVMISELMARNRRNGGNDSGNDNSADLLAVEPAIGVSVAAALASEISLRFGSNG